MKPIFADTYYFLAVLNARDMAHSKAVEITRTIEAPLATTEWVLAEVGDAMSVGNNRKAFVDFFHFLQNHSQVTIVAPSSFWFDKGIDLFGSRPDKEWTLTDCISFAVMTEMGLTQALTGDRHFSQAGFEVLL